MNGDPIRLPFPTAHSGTVAYWRSVAPFRDARTWRGAMERHARQHGRAVAMLGNDGARIVTFDPATGRVQVQTLPACSVIWTLTF